MVEMNQTRCIACGCTELAPCLGMLTAGGTCFWTWVSDDGKHGLCSACATKPLDELKRCLELVRP